MLVYPEVLMWLRSRSRWVRWACEARAVAIRRAPWSLYKVLKGER